MRRALEAALAVTVSVGIVLACGGNPSTGNPVTGGSGFGPGGPLTGGGGDAGSGDGGTPDGGTGTAVTVIGAGANALQELPAAAVFLSSTFALGDVTQFQVDLVDPVRLLSGTEVTARLGDSPVTPVALAGGGGSYTVTGVDPAQLADATQTPALVAYVRDRAVTPRQTRPTASFVLSLVPPAAAGGAYTFPPGNPLVADAPAYVVPDAFATPLAQLVIGSSATAAALADMGYIAVYVGLPQATIDLIPGYTVTYPYLTGAGLETFPFTDSLLGLAIITGPPTTAPLTITAHTPLVPACTAAVTTGCLAPARALLLPGVAFTAPVVRR